MKAQVSSALVPTVINFPADRKAGTLASSGFYKHPTDENDYAKPFTVYGSTVSAKHADAFGGYLDSLKYSSQKDAAEAILCGNLTTGTGTDEVKELVALLFSMLGGNYRGGMATATALPVFAALKALYGEKLKEVRGGSPANFAAALRNVADAIEAGKDLKNTSFATGSISKDH